MKLTRRDIIRYFSSTASFAVAHASFFGLIGCTTNPGKNTESISDKESITGDWDHGELAHLIPIANHNRFLLKTSFTVPLSDPPRLKVAERVVEGTKQDTDGRFWSFDVADLEPSTEYFLQLFDRNSKPLTDHWPLRTFPAPGQNVGKLRILAYTCAGGDEEIMQSDGQSMFIPMEYRKRLLARGLSMKPDVVIANGDHVYWDEKSMTRDKPKIIMDAWRAIQAKLGVMNPGKPVLGTSNETILKRVADRQIAHLYGVSLRSTPTYMLTDDHDLFENDEATDDYITLPPNQHLLDAARTTQHLYYPEFLPDQTRPLKLAGSDLPDRTPGLSETFGTIRFGALFEGLLYDTKRYVSIDGEKACMVPPEVEKWLENRTARQDTIHLAHVPSTPVAWSAGKWGEWYPDVLGDTGHLVTDKEKPYWLKGWWKQHQRLLKVLSQQENRIPLVISGDLHMIAGAKIVRSGNLDLSENPVHSFVVGPLGTGGPAYPSAARGVLPQTPTSMEATEYQRPLEKNGFTIIDISRNEISLEMYAWRYPKSGKTIEEMAPINRIVLRRKS